VEEGGGRKGIGLLHSGTNTKKEATRMLHNGTIENWRSHGPLKHITLRRENHYCRVVRLLKIKEKAG
jgi:hypothetical protein